MKRRMERMRKKETFVSCVSSSLWTYPWIVSWTISDKPVGYQCLPETCPFEKGKSHQGSFPHDPAVTTVVWGIDSS